MKKRSVLLAFFAVAALAVVEITHPPLAAASQADTAKDLVQANLVDPLHKKEESRPRFSRAVSLPRARRVRILENSAQTDAKGQAFLPFAIDESRSFGAIDAQKIAEADWLKDTITGCVYPATGEILVKRGEVYYPASVLLGTNASAAPQDVCRLR